MRPPLLAGCLCTLAAIHGAPAQDRLPWWKVDPHTRNDPELMAVAGYESFGPFGFGGTSTQSTLTSTIDRELDPVRILWVETAHFRIGSSLETMVAPTGRDERNKIRNELTRLAKRLPRVSPASRRIGPWLRLHLLAQRMEELYGSFQNWLGVTDADFPADTAAANRLPEAQYMGQGPYLGQPQKYLVLVLEEQDQYSAYMRRFFGQDPEFSHRWNFADVGSLFFGTAAELQDRRFKNDTALHCHLAFNVTRNLIDGYRYYAYQLPVWITEGVSHWFERRVSPRWNTVSESIGTMGDRRSVWQWEKLAGELAIEADSPSFRDVYTWRDAADLGFEDHVLIWSRIDFLMARGQEPFARFMSRLKKRSSRDVLALTRQALDSAYGLNVVGLDDAWIEWLDR